jgi:hypothetical protein
MSKEKTCYYCGDISTSKEHVPPKMLFRAFDCDSITVPSCPEHNDRKSDEDQAIIAVFMVSLKEGNNIYDLSSDVRKAIEYERKKSTFPTTKNTAKSTPFFQNVPDGIKLPNVGHLKLSTGDVYDWVRQITAGLVYDATKKHDPSVRWDQSVIHSPNWVPADRESLEFQEGLDSLADKAEKTQYWDELEWKNGWSAYPRPYPSDIYRFYVFFANPILFKHVFYNSYTWYVGFECNEGTRKSLGHKVLEQNGL